MERSNGRGRQTTRHLKLDCNAIRLPVSGRSPETSLPALSRSKTARPSYRYWPWAVSLHTCRPARRACLLNRPSSCLPVRFTNRVEWRSGHHASMCGVVVRHAVFGRPLLSSDGHDVARADELDARGVRQVGQILGRRQPLTRQDRPAESSLTFHPARGCEPKCRSGV